LTHPAYEVTLQKPAKPFGSSWPAAMVWTTLTLQVAEAVGTLCCAEVTDRHRSAGPGHLASLVIAGSASGPAFRALPCPSVC
jgi:hypothetical protein